MSERNMSEIIKVKRTVKSKILLFSLVMTLAMILNISLCVIVSFNQTLSSINRQLDENAVASKALIENRVESLLNLVGEHLGDYEFINGSEQEKTAHAAAIAAANSNTTAVVFKDSSGSYGGELPSKVSAALTSSSRVLALSDDYSEFSLAVKSNGGDIICVTMSMNTLTPILNGCPNDTVIISASGKTIAASANAPKNNDFSSFVCTDDNVKTQIRPAEDINAAYCSIAISNSEGCTLVVRTDVEYHYSGMIMILVVGAVVIVLFISLCLIANSFFSKRVTVPLKKIQDKISEMAEGKISGADIDYKLDDDIGALAASVNKMAHYNGEVISDITYTAGEIADENLCVKPGGDYYGDYVPVKKALESIVNSVHDVIQNVEQAGRQVSAGSDQMSRNSAVLSQAADEEAITVKQLNESLNSVYSQSNDNSDKAATARAIADESMELVNEGNEKMMRMLDAMNEISDTSSQIANIIKTIQDISSQTNILSLNASIEAARAGEAGKGFAVVAGEVGSLANKTAEAAKSTTQLIETSINAVKNGTVIANDTAEMLKKIVEKTDATSKVVGEIADSSAQQAASVKEVLAGMTGISDTVVRISDSARECADSSEELATQAAMLHDTVDRFVVDESKVKPKKPKSASAGAGVSVSEDTAGQFGSTPKHEPVKAKSEPAKPKPEPAKPKPEPAKQKPEPAKAKPAPAKPKPEPAKAKPEPVKEKAPKKPAKPVSKKPEPITTTAAPEPPKPAEAPKTQASIAPVKLPDAKDATPVNTSNPVSRATAQPVKRNIRLDDNKY